MYTSEWGALSLYFITIDYTLIIGYLLRQWAQSLSNDSLKGESCVCRSLILQPTALKIRLAGHSINLPVTDNAGVIAKPGSPRL